VRQSINPTVTPSLTQRFWSHVPNRPDAGCWNWNDRDTGGYGLVWIGPKNQKILAHRLSWLIHFGDIPQGLCVCHHCDNKRCIRPDHLYLATIKQNNRDAWARGLCESIRNRKYYRGGEKGPGHRLTWPIVREIRARHACGATPTMLGQEFGVHPGHIGGIIKNRYWREEDAPNHQGFSP
jgi:hypothetical protein